MLRKAKEAPVSPIVSSVPSVSKEAESYPQHLMGLTATELGAPFSGEYLGKQYKISLKTDGSRKKNKCFHVDKIEDWYNGSDGFKPKTKLKAVVRFVYERIAEHQQQWLPFNFEAQGRGGKMSRAMNRGHLPGWGVGRLVCLPSARDKICTRRLRQQAKRVKEGDDHGSAP